MDLIGLQSLNISFREICSEIIVTWVKDDFQESSRIRSVMKRIAIIYGMFENLDCNYICPF